MAHTFPDDLVQAQRDWYRTYRQLVDADVQQTAALRRTLLRLSVRIASYRLALSVGVRLMSEPV